MRTFVILGALAGALATTGCNVEAAEGTGSGASAQTDVAAGGGDVARIATIARALELGTERPHAAAIAPNGCTGNYETVAEHRYEKGSVYQVTAARRAGIAARVETKAPAFCVVAKSQAEGESASAVLDGALLQAVVTLGSGHLERIESGGGFKLLFTFRNGSAAGATEIGVDPTAGLGAQTEPAPSTEEFFQQKWEAILQPKASTTTLESSLGAIDWIRDDDPSTERVAARTPFGGHIDLAATDAELVTLVAHRHALGALLRATGSTFVFEGGSVAFDAARSKYVLAKGGGAGFELPIEPSDR